jgi:hypothetical protein
MRSPQRASESAAPAPAWKPGVTSQPTNFIPGSSDEGAYLLIATNVGSKATEGAEITITDTLLAGAYPAWKLRASTQPTHPIRGSSSEGEPPRCHQHRHQGHRRWGDCDHRHPDRGFGVACETTNQREGEGESMNIEAKTEAELEVGAEVKLRAKVSSRLRAKLTCGVVLGAAIFSGISTLAPDTQIEEMASKSHLVGKRIAPPGSMDKGEHKLAVSLGEAEVTIVSTTSFPLKVTQGVTCSMRGSVKFCNLSIKISSGPEADAELEPRR